MKKFSALIFGFAVIGSVFAAETELVVKSPADFRGTVAAVKESADGLRISAGRNLRIETKERLKIVPDAKYLISFEFRKAPGSAADGGIYLAPVNYDAKGRVILCDVLSPVVGSETTLAAPARRGDKIVKIKNGAAWKVKYGRIAFDAKADLSDLPNFSLVRLSDVKQAGDVWEVTLQTPLKQDYPAGTAVRNHFDGATYRYLLGGNRKPAENWTRIESVISGFSRDNVPGKNRKWRIGAASAGVIIFSLSKSPVDVEIRNLKIKQVK